MKERAEFFSGKKGKFQVKKKCFEPGKIGTWIFL